MCREEPTNTQPTRSPPSTCIPRESDEKRDQRCYTASYQPTTRIKVNYLVMMSERSRICNPN